MKDIVINLVENNQYYVKTPFKGEIIRLLVSENDEVGENQCIGVVKTDRFYFELECEYPGIIGEIFFSEGDIVDRWDTLTVINVKENYDRIDMINVNSKEYDLLYNFQQKDLPKAFYTNVNSFLSEISNNADKFIFNLIKDIFDDNNLILPFDSFDLSVSVEKINGNDFIQLNWPDFKIPLLAKRSYFLVNGDNLQYFTCENSLDNELMISAIIDNNGHLIRYNYGSAPNDIDLEKNRIIEIFQ